MFSQDKISISRTDGDIDRYGDNCISEDNVEIRRLTSLITVSKILEITSYLEISIAHQSADLAHPAFNNLYQNRAFA